MSEEILDNHFKIRIHSLHADRPIPFDLFVSINKKYVHYLRAGDHLSQHKIDAFEKKAPDSFYIQLKDRQAYKNYVHEQIKSDLAPKEKALILRESTFSLIEELFESPDVSQALEDSKQTIGQFIQLMDEDSSAMANLLGLSSHDFYTYNHSLDVGIYSLGLAQAVGYQGEDLSELGRGALFHDIGKRNVAVEIITKAGPLDEVEWAQMRKHPQFGLGILNEYNVSDEIKACCLEHHESHQGNGYPQSLDAEEIHPMARIVAIADTYDALTTKRSYNQPMTPKDALIFMKEKLAARFDPELLTAMHSILFKIELKT